MNLQHIAPGLVQPGQNNNVVACRKTIKALGHQRTHFKPGVWRALRTLLGRFAAFFDAGTDNANRAKLCAAFRLPACSHLSPSSLVGLHRESPLSRLLILQVSDAARSTSPRREASATASTCTIVSHSIVPRSKLDSRPRPVLPSVNSTGIRTVFAGLTPASPGGQVNDCSPFLPRQLLRKTVAVVTRGSVGAASEILGRKRTAQVGASPFPRCVTAECGLPVRS